MSFHAIVASGLAGLGTMFVAVAASGAPDENRNVSAAPLVVTAFGGKSQSYKAPLTAWGEPDLQGVWSSDDTNGIPLSRPARFGDRLYLTDAELADRQKQVNRGVVQAEDKAAGTFRFDFARRAFPQTSLIVDPPDGRMPEYVPAALKHPMPRGTYGNGPLDSPRDFSLYERCITRGIVGSVLRVIYGNGNRIVQAPGMVAITYEMVHDTRLIYTDGRQHVGQSIRQYLGDSRGHWEDRDLVVETTNLTDRTAIGLNGGGIRHSTHMKLTERFRRVAYDMLQYQITMDDPMTYQRPFTISMPLTPLDGGQLLPYECHEGNMALLQALGGERAEDRKLAADLARGIRRPRRPVQNGLGIGGQPVGEPLPGTLPGAGPAISGGR